ncbi:N-acyl-D-glucosamine 2-epimerase [Niastella koreensis]|uniref:Cellobiose 2-epimerase n=2 Tax=Niastella koreensis TaxID=354356 RepID=G8TH40_NIAKG|nr:AGE family epimerase/isomerase [Niastella koreensis]AEW00651.1 N-acylglucosamine 2-epimerase [Niastella koreensis GR20-10]OQP42283.1 N-acyl-D-glucosamine 2-epimerase [Niastella koreensis]
MNGALFKNELQHELLAILDYWLQHAVDEQQGGFYGRIDNSNTKFPDAPKGSVLNARILWTFSAAYSLTGDPRCATAADRAFTYIREHFVDSLYGGVYWSVTSNGKSYDAKKQVYALAFVLYGCSEYYRATQNEHAKALAIQLYEVIQQKSYDHKEGGYFEAFDEHWELMKDLRLSEKDANEKKTMNTHLHILEAFTSLYNIFPDELLAKHIADLLHIFHDRIINQQTGHLHLFFDEHWNVKSDTVSYGHDIEASWLLLEAAETIGDKELIEQMRANALKMADAVIIGLDTDGGLWYEYEAAQNRLIKEKHWWPQAEAMVGFYNAWQISDQHEYLQYAYNVWAFIKQYIRDDKNGEWFWGVNEDHSVMQGQDKVGLWKCPYHNGRACIELIKRIGKDPPAGGWTSSG